MSRRRQVPPREIAPARDSVARLLSACVESSAATDDWSSRMRNFGTEISGCACNVHVKVQALRQVVGSATRVTGELFVYVTSEHEGGLTGGMGWLHFVSAESAVEHGAFLYDTAFGEALAQLRSKPLFASMREQLVLERDVPRAARPARAAPRRL